MECLKKRSFSGGGESIAGFFALSHFSRHNCFMADHSIYRNDSAHRFEVAFGKKIAKIDYARSNGRLNLLHTEVPKEYQGQGIGSDLAKAALEYARTEKLEVIPTCPFISSYIRRHPQYLDIVASSYRQKIQQC
jgi:predicted GNAT family acetyltransferase